MSGAKAQLLNLAGSHSSLFYELQRVWHEVQEAAPTLETVLFAENVCSMDSAARDTISRELGLTPYRVDSEFIVPMSRPRFVWTNLGVREDNFVWTEWKGGFWQVYFECEPLGTTLWAEQVGGRFTKLHFFRRACVRSFVLVRPNVRWGTIVVCLMSSFAGDRTVFASHLTNIEIAI